MNYYESLGFIEEFAKNANAILPKKFVKNVSKGQKVKPNVKHVKPEKLNIKRPKLEATAKGKAPTL